MNLTISPVRGQAARTSIQFLIKSLILAVLLSVVTGNPTVSAGNLLSPHDQALYKKAFRAAKNSNWANALGWAGKAQNPLPAKALQWMHYLKRGNQSKFSEIAAFLKANPNWPSIEILIRRAEEAMERSHISDQAALDWFTRHHPLTGPGQMRLAEAMLAMGLPEEGNNWLRYAWVNNRFSRQQSKTIYRDHHQTLTQADHLARLDRLLWLGHRHSARRLYSLIPKGYRKLAEARESLMVQAPGVDGKIAAVPYALLADTGLIFERLRWRRRKGLDQRAQEILLKPIRELGPRPEKWWLERHIQIRMALRESDVDLAYRLASEHRQKAGGFSFAQAEWLAGWIALRHVEKANRALHHFVVLYKNVRYPVSLARAAYWAGRANAALGRRNDATAWYKAATRYPGTYYGQLAFQAIDYSGSWLMPKEPTPTPAAIVNFKKRELIQLSHLLAELGQENLLRPFLLHLADIANNPSERTLVARLSADLGQSALAVRTAKISLRQGTFLPRTGYPILAALPPMKIEPALIHAVARQESEFNPRAVSSASARGLMQLLPQTARKIAKSLRIAYRRDRLFDAWYNMRLGSAYLGQMVNKYRGSYILALAAYNAGPNRVKRWLRQNGDPRNGVIDPIDWIELIPITETRNYVQRVMENLQVYRWRLKPKLAVLTLLQDLHRNGLP